MTKKEQLWEKIKNNINTEYAGRARIAQLGALTINCDECPCDCEDKSIFGNNCFSKFYRWLGEHGDEEVEE